MFSFACHNKSSHAKWSWSNLAAQLIIHSLALHCLMNLYDLTYTNLHIDLHTYLSKLLLCCCWICVSPAVQQLVSDTGCKCQCTNEHTDPATNLNVHIMLPATLLQCWTYLLLICTVLQYSVELMFDLYAQTQILVREGFFERSSPIGSAHYIFFKVL